MQNKMLKRFEAWNQSWDLRPQYRDLHGLLRHEMLALIQREQRRSPSSGAAEIYRRVSWKVLSRKASAVYLHYGHSRESVEYFRSVVKRSIASGSRSHGLSPRAKSRAGARALREETRRGQASQRSRQLGEAASSKPRRVADLERAS